MRKICSDNRDHLSQKNKFRAMGTWSEYLDIRMKLGVHEAFGVHETWCADNVKRAVKKRSNIRQALQSRKNRLLAAVVDERKILGMHPNATFALPAQN